MTTDPFATLDRTNIASGSELARRSTMTTTGGRSRSSTGRPFAAYVVVALVLLMPIACGEERAPRYETTETDNVESVSVTRPPLSDAARAGEALFNANCSLCHGVNAAGTRQGPPLVDKIYGPGHHSDFSFRNAIRQGVQQHHWSFGNMPPVSGVLPDEVEQIICYVREMQRANGIFERDAYPTTC